MRTTIEVGSPPVNVTLIAAGGAVGIGAGQPGAGTWLTPATAEHLAQVIRATAEAARRQAGPPPLRLAK